MYKALFNIWKSVNVNHYNALLLFSLWIFSYILEQLKTRKPFSLIPFPVFSISLCRFNFLSGIVFPSVCRLFFNISSRLIRCHGSVSQETFFSSSFFKQVFTGYRILVDRVFFFQRVKMLLHYLPTAWSFPESLVIPSFVLVCIV